MGSIKLALTFLSIWSVWPPPCLAAGADEDIGFLELTNSRLPTPAAHFATVYDGNDSIYLIGGYTSTGFEQTVLAQVVKYSLDSDQVTLVETLVPTYAGSAVMIGDDILYYGGRPSTSSYSDRIYSYSTRDNNFSEVGRLPVQIAFSSVAWDSANQITYLFGGTSGQRSNRVIRHNTNTNEVSQIASLPVAIDRATAAWVGDGGGGVAYNFGGDDPPYTHQQTVLHFDPTHGNVTTLPVSLPYRLVMGCAVYAPDRKQVYMFGGTRFLLRFDTATHHTEKLYVEGWPVSLHGAGCVHVPRLDRMYIFGGYGNYNGGGGQYLDEISYVDLDIDTTDTTTTTSEEPTTESTICPPEGIISFPYPGNCTLYIRCFHGDPRVLSCYPLRFDTRELICKPVAEAFCDEEGISSTEQPEPGPCPPIGYEVFPHESNCSKYYECNDGIAYESDCATNTYFDIHHEIRRCNQAQLASCNAECPVFGIEFQPIRARGCKWYKVCIEGHSTNLECGDGDLYEPQLQRCIPEQQYICPYVFTV